MAGPLAVQCPLCKRWFGLPSRLGHVDPDANQVQLIVDRSELYGHLQACAAEQAQGAEETADGGERPAQAPGKALEKCHPSMRDRMYVDQTLRSGAFVVRGTRTCILCGIPSAECLARLTRSGKACCQGCGNGNTHPAPQESTPCAEWGASHGA